jgi:hypothetical protein
VQFEITDDPMRLWRWSDHRAATPNSSSRPRYATRSQESAALPRLALDRVMGSFGAGSGERV